MSLVVHDIIPLPCTPLQLILSSKNIRDAGAAGLTKLLMANRMLTRVCWRAAPFCVVRLVVTVRLRNNTNWLRCTARSWRQRHRRRGYCQTCTDICGQPHIGMGLLCATALPIARISWAVLRWHLLAFGIQLILSMSCHSYTSKQACLSI